MSVNHAVGDKVEITGVITFSEAVGDNPFTRKHVLTLDSGDASYTFKISPSWERTHRGFSKDLGYVAGNTLSVKATVIKTTYFSNGNTPEFLISKVCLISKVGLISFSLGEKALQKREELIKNRISSPCKEHLMEELEEKRDAAAIRGYDAIIKATRELLECQAYEERVCPVHGGSMEYPVTTPTK